MPNPLAADLDDIVERTKGFEELRGERLFITGGTGFVGSWILESLAWANDRLGLGAEAVVLTRDPAAFARKLPHLASRPFVKSLRGDIRTFAFPDGAFSHVIHGAAPVTIADSKTAPRELFETIVNGTQHLLDFAGHCGARRLLLTSSGAVYGQQPAGVERLEEAATTAPSCTEPRSAYAEGKRVAELLCVMAAAAGGPEAKIARCFGFGGPYLPLEAHYAFGNFIRDALAGGPIRVGGDGTARRSYLYAGEMTHWLWTILFRGTSGRPYNVGSDEAVSVARLAEIVSAETVDRVAVVVEGRQQAGLSGNLYVPSTERARRELGLQAAVGVQETVKKTLAWHRTCAESEVRQ